MSKVDVTRRSRHAMGGSRKRKAADATPVPAHPESPAPQMPAPPAAKRPVPPSPRAPPPPPSSSADTLATPSDKYDLLEVVGEGTFSVVRKARRRSDATTVAVKRLKKLEQAAARIRDEVSCLRALTGCAHIVQLLDCHRADGQIDIIMPYFEHADFAEALAADRFNRAHTRCYMRGLFRALAHIHEKGCAHRCPAASPP